MLKIFLCLFVVFVFSACGGQSASNSPAPGKGGGEQASKKVQAGNNLKFNCPDSSRNTHVVLLAEWDAATSVWIVSIDERDVAGNQIRHLNNLSGEADQIEDLHMNITEGSIRYARVIQTGVSQALYIDGRRNLACTFE